MMISGRMIWAWHWHVWWSEEIHLAFFFGGGGGAELKVGDRLDVLDMGGRIELECVLNDQAGGGCVNWINLALNRGKWRAVVNTVMNIWFP
jgi:hypothetical protein